MDLPITLASAAAWAFAGVNAVALAAFFADKRLARRRARRVPEATLILLALFGGFAGGAAGIVLFRHKTRKPGFLIRFAAASAVSIAAWLALARSVT
jgi:uncharacterized membrane protein YsdA (DUF1294 family)